MAVTFSVVVSARPFESSGCVACARYQSTVVVTMSSQAVV